MCPGKRHARFPVSDRTPRGTMIIVDTSTPVASVVLPARASNLSSEIIERLNKSYEKEHGLIYVFIATRLKPKELLQKRH